MSLNVCSKLCGECPFSKNSAKGWLADYTPQDIQNFMNGEALFPCHKMVEGDELTQAEVKEKILSGELKLCRGYVESMVKSCKMPKFNKILLEARALVKEEGLSADSMSIFEFIKYHGE